MLDIFDSVLGEHIWELLEKDGIVFCVPNLLWCLKALFLLVFVYWFIRGLFVTVRLIS